LNFLFFFDQTWKFSLFRPDYKADLSRLKLGAGWRIGGDLYYGRLREPPITQTCAGHDRHRTGRRPIYADTLTIRTTSTC